MVVVDPLSNYAIFVVAFKGCVAEKVDKPFMKNMVKYYGLARMIVSDRDPQFIGQSWREHFKLLGSELHMSTTLHPQIDGQTEWINHLLGIYLRHFVTAIQSNWVRLLDMAQLAYNLQKSKATTRSPYELVTGQQSLTPAMITSDYKGSCL
ncbi:DNA-directed DNA polymerase [Bertholletia excelsa]